MAEFVKIRVVGAPQERTTKTGKKMLKLPVVFDTTFNGVATTSGANVTLWENDDVPAPGDYFLGARPYQGQYNEMGMKPVFIPVTK